MIVNGETYYHIVQNPDAIPKFRKSKSVTFPPDRRSRYIEHIYQYFPTINLSDGTGPRGLVNACFNLKKSGKKSFEIDVNFLFETFMTVNWRYMEELFETYRQANHPDLPSRTSCVFLSNKTDVEEWHKAVTKFGEAPVFEVRAYGTIHSADHRWLDTDVMQRDKYFEYAKHYWNGDSFTKEERTVREILFLGRLEKVREFASLGEFLHPHPGLLP